ncbi:MAG: cytochrome c [Candidatus Marinimicrobia bacterium]|nr:cytochrome c [Candidatus Neomarinimicrobiota bacterium]
MNVNSRYKINSMIYPFRLMKKVSIMLVLMILTYSTTLFSQELEITKKGKTLYEYTCSYCHGLDGRGNGPAGDFLIPAPRDFTTGIYKFRQTESGSVPTDWDLYESITKGVHGTSMIRWNDLSEEQRWQLVSYIKTFSDKFQEDEKPQIITVGIPPRPTRESISRGRQFFIDAECWKCHGNSGKGDGPSADELKDTDGKISIPRDLTIGKNYGRGSSQEDIYITIISGLDGTPMPSYMDAFEDMDEELWDLVNYVYSLSND